jgi:hypothetical protein
MVRRRRYEVTEMYALIEIGVSVASGQSLQSKSALGFNVAQPLLRPEVRDIAIANRQGRHILRTQLSKQRLR